MDSVEQALQVAQLLVTEKYVMVSGVTLTLYDCFLMFGGEIRYVWRGRKTWIFYLYTMNRIILIVYQLWQIYYLSSPRHSKIFCFVVYFGHPHIFLIFSSEIFITLRIYAITFKNKILLAYFGTLMLARLGVWLASAFSKFPVVMDFPRIPVDAFNLCATFAELKFRLVPISIGTVFVLSALLVVVWCTYHIGSSALIRTIAADATICFLAMVAAQVCIQLTYSFMEGVPQQISFVAYTIINPILTLRFALSLKQSADPDGDREWQLKHFSMVNFASGPLPDTQAPAVHEDIEMDPVDLPNHQPQTREP